MRILHAGCGGTELPPIFANYSEVRLDVDPQMRPDVLANLTNMGDIGQFEMVYSAHCVEHLYPHQVSEALAEFYRVTKPGGTVMIVVPNLEGLEISDKPLFDSPAGPVSALDMIYGYGPLLDKQPTMAHHTGFTPSILEKALYAAGFAHVVTRRVDYDLFAVAVKGTL